MGTFLEEMMGFSHNLVRGKEPVPLFDPEAISVNLLKPESDDSEGDGTSLFKTQALCYCTFLAIVIKQTLWDFVEL